jgi:hypothetical protein
MGPEWLIAVSQFDVVTYANVGKLFLEEKLSTSGKTRSKNYYYVT